MNATRGVVVNSVPKSGTNMLVPAVGAAVPPGGPWIELYEGWPAQMDRHRAAIVSQPEPVFVRGHIYHSTAWASMRVELGLPMIFLYRDPRDIVVSYVHWLMGPDHAVGRIQTYIRDHLGDHQTRLRAMITGFSFGTYTHADIRSFVSRFIPWMDEPGVECVRFEHLVSAGRRATLSRIARYLHGDGQVQFGDEQAIDRMIAAMDPSESRTFRQGRAGSWRNEFDAQTSGLFDDVAGDLVIRLGYDRADGWTG